MRVVCTKILNPVKDIEASSPWVTLDAEYVVLAIHASPERGMELRILDDQGPGASLWPAEMFMTVASDIPSNWVVAIGEDGRCDFAPAKWLRPGFWEDYFNGDADAIASFEDEKETILTEMTS